MALWPHQEQALLDLKQLISFGHKKICITSPTGGGKTRMAMTHLINSNLPSVFYTHRKMLLQQTSDNFRIQGINHGIRASGHRPCYLDDIQLAMIQSEAAAVFTSKSRELHKAKEILIDEAHNNSATQALKIIDGHGKECVTIGLTATPLGIGHVYDKLIVAGRNSELRSCGSHVPSFTFGPDEPSVNLVGKVAIGEGECGIAKAKRQIFAQRVYGSVVKHYEILNPDRTPTILFAPGVQESMWFCQTLNEQGITAAHIDGKNCYVDGELHPTDDDIRSHIAKRAKAGDIQIVCNRFVLREGIDWPWVRHMIFATVFGSLTSYLQAGGRGLRNCDGKDNVIVQDHGGNWWRHGSLNSDREWNLGDTDRIVGNARIAEIREGEATEPIHCPKCNALRNGGAKCWSCGYQTNAKTRPVLQADGSLKSMTNDKFRKRRRMAKSQSVEKQWVNRIRGIMRSKKDSVKKMTFAQAEVSFARDNGWAYPPKDLPMMPTVPKDWYRPVSEVPIERLSR